MQRYSILQKKHARKPVPIFLFKQLQAADWPLVGSSSLGGKIGTGLRAHFSAEWSNVECGSK